jgi:hypothetical protein
MIKNKKLNQLCKNKNIITLYMSDSIRLMLNNLATEINRISQYSDKHLTKIVKQGGEIFSKNFSNRGQIKAKSSSSVLQLNSGQNSKKASKKASKKVSKNVSKKASKKASKKNISGGSGEQIVSLIDTVIDNKIYIAVLFILLYILYYFIPKPKTEFKGKDKIILEELPISYNNVFPGELIEFLENLNDRLVTFGDLNLTNIYRNQLTKYVTSTGTNTVRTGAIRDMSPPHSQQPGMGENMNYNVWFALHKSNSDAYNEPGRRTITFDIFDKTSYHLLYLHDPTNGDIHNPVTNDPNRWGRIDIDKEFIKTLNDYMFKVNNAIKNSGGKTRFSQNTFTIKTILEAFGLNVDESLQKRFNDPLNNREELNQANLEDFNFGYGGVAKIGERNSTYDEDRRWTEYLCDFFNSLTILLNYLPDEFEVLKNDLLSKITSTVGYFHHDTYTHTNTEVFSGELTISQYYQANIIQDITNTQTNHPIQPRGRNGVRGRRRSSGSSPVRGR